MLSLNKDLRDKVDKLSCFPLVVKNFLSEDDINLFMGYVSAQNFGELSENYWDGRVILLSSVKDIQVQNLLISKRIEIMQLTESILLDNGIDHKLYSDTICFSRWPEGYALEPHADSENTDDTRHEYPCRNFGSVMYLNSDYDGGEIYFPRIGLKFKPEPGTMILFPGTLKYLHGVKKITTGVRHTVATFLSFDNDQHVNYSR